MPLLPKCRCKLANGCHESYESRLHFVCVWCVALHLRDDQLRIKFRFFLLNPADLVAHGPCRQPHARSEVGEGGEPERLQPVRGEAAEDRPQGRGNARRPQGGIHQTSPQVKGYDEKNNRIKARKITERK